eukprot:57684-Hanusia_phi.AAC.2
MIGVLTTVTVNLRCLPPPPPPAISLFSRAFASLLVMSSSYGGRREDVARPLRSQAHPSPPGSSPA